MNIVFPAEREFYLLIMGFIFFSLHLIMCIMCQHCLFPPQLIIVSQSSLIRSVQPLSPLYNVPNSGAPCHCTHSYHLRVSAQLISSAMLISISIPCCFIFLLSLFVLPVSMSATRGQYDRSLDFQSRRQSQV